MGGLSTFISVGLRDNFSKGMAAMLNSSNKFKSSLAKLGQDSAIDRTAANFSMMSMNLKQTASDIASLVEEPRKLAMSFQDSMATVSSVIADGEKGLANIKNAALDWSKIHSDSAKSFVDTSYIMIGAGLNTNEAILATRQSMLLAKATMGDSVDSANLLATVYNNMGNKFAGITDETKKFQLQQLEMTRLSNIIAKTQGVFQIKDMGQLSEGMKYAIPSAQQYGMKLENIAAVIGQLNNSGMQGSMAGTGLSEMMAQMVKASGKLGFSMAYDSDGGLDLVNTIGNIKNKFGDLDKASNSVKLALQDAFGVQGLRSVTLLSSSFSQLQSNYQAVYDSGNATNDMYGKITDTMSNKMLILQNRQNALKMKVAELSQGSDKWGMSMGNAILSIQEKFVASPIGEKLTIWGYGVANLGSKFLTSTSGTLQFTSSLLTTISLASKLKDIASLAGSGLSVMFNGVRLLGSGFLTVLPAIWSFTVSLLACPITWIVLGIVALAGAVFLIIKNWGVIAPWLKDLWNKITGIFKAGWDFIWNGILNNKIVQGALAVFLPFIGIPIIIIKNWNVISGFFIGIWKNVSNGAKSGFDKVKSFITGAFDSIQNNKIIRTALNILAWPVTLPLTIIKNWNILPDFFKSIFSAVGKKAEEFGKLIGKPFQIIGDTFGKIFGSKSELNVKNDLGKIPHNAKGTNYFSGGLSLVGENGPELVYLERGTKVFNNSETNSIMTPGNRSRRNGHSAPSSSGKIINLYINKPIYIQADDVKNAVDFYNLLLQEAGVYG